MSRQKMVTRTFKTMSCSVLVADKEMGELKNIVVKLPREITDPIKLHKACAKAITDSNLVIVEVTDFTTEEKLYGMPESDFIANAIEISRTEKAE